VSPRTRYHVTVAGRTLEVEIGPDGTTVDGRPVDAEMEAVSDSPVRSLLLDHRSHRLVAHARGKGRWELHLHGRRVDADVVDQRTRAIRAITGASAAASGPRPVRAPMPGLIVRIEVAEGDVIQPGQGLVIVEAMKMENELRAETTGTVVKIHVAAGEAVAKDQVLIDLAPAPTAGEG
jgi:pyruvate carboxylase subunit B